MGKLYHCFIKPLRYLGFLLPQQSLAYSDQYVEINCFNHLASDLLPQGETFLFLIGLFDIAKSRGHFFIFLDFLAAFVPIDHTPWKHFILVSMTMCLLGFSPISRPHASQFLLLALLLFHPKSLKFLRVYS